MDREFILGTHISPIYNLRVGETHHEVKTILDIIYEYRIGKFVEIGVHEGGLTEYLMNQTSLSYLGIEINESIPDQRIKDLVASNGQRLLFMDCFSFECYKIVQDFVNTQGRTLIYCDNGNKPAEIMFYDDIPHKFDILLTHDYSDGIRKIKDWDGYGNREVTPEDIKFMEDNPSYSRIPEILLSETRLVGWVKK